jgi:hypothetical protein
VADSSLVGILVDGRPSRCDADRMSQSLPDGLATAHGNRRGRDGVLMGMKTGPEFEDFVRDRSAVLLRTAYAPGQV